MSFDRCQDHGTSCLWLVAEMCPDGVELRALGEVGQFMRGSGLQKKDFVEGGLPIHPLRPDLHLYGTSAAATKSFITPAMLNYS